MVTDVWCAVQIGVGTRSMLVWERVPLEEEEEGGGRRKGLFEGTTVNEEDSELDRYAGVFRIH